ncbi:MAG TPA: fibronectin type III domain-containing protein [Flavipsychrobacter sp.]|nr:fibronectin type III domain-containing protein [Flavipsychrobacter sp.]
MMKNLLVKRRCLLFLLLFCSLGGKAQISANYSFSQTTGTYVPLGAGATILAAATTPDQTGPEAASLDDIAFTNNSLPFPFTFNGATYTSFDAITNGWIGFGGANTANTGTALNNNVGNAGVIVAFGTDLMGVSNAAGIVSNGSNIITNVTNTAFAKIGAPFRSGTYFPAGTVITAFTSTDITVSNNATGGSTSAVGIQWALGEIKTQLSGVAPNRTFTIEYANFAEYFAATTTNANTTNVNFQIILNEGGGLAQNQSITVVYGDVLRFAGSEAIQVGLGGGILSQYFNRATSTDWSNTIGGTSNSATCTWSLTVAPPSGLTYVWTPSPCTPPGALSSTNITTSSAEIVWGQSPSFPANGYDLYYSTSSTAPASNTAPTANTVAGDTTETLSNLLPGTTYYVWVRANCGPTSSDVSGWKPLPSFITTCVVPSNDDCANAVPLIQGTTCVNTAGTTCGATLSMAAAPCTGNPDDDVWFSFVATQTDASIELSNVTASTTANASTDAYFQVFDGGLSGNCTTPMTSLLCSDPNTGIIGGLTIGHTYFIRVYTYPVAPAAINFNICVKELSAAPACSALSTPGNNALVSTTSFPLSWAVVTNATSYDIYLDGTNPPSTLFATANGNATNSYMIPSSALSLGDHYWYVVPKNNVGAPTTCASNTRKFTVVAPPANDDCINAIQLTQSTTCVNTVGTTLGATQSLAAAPCSGNPDDDVWFSFVATQTDASIELSGVTASSPASTSTDAYFQVFDGGPSGNCTATMTSLLCSDPNTGIVGGLTIGHTYFIRVYTYPVAPAAINFSICVKEITALPTTCPTLNNPGVNNTVSVTPTLTWSTVANASLYDVYLDVTNPPTTVVATVTTPSYTVPSPLAIGDHYFYIAPKNNLGALTTCAGNARKFTVAAAPANDNCSNAVVLTHGTSTVGTAGTTLGATQSLAAAPCSGNPDDDVWYKFVATNTSAQIALNIVVPATTANTSADAYFQVIDGGTSGACTPTGNSLLCSDPNSDIVSGLTIGNTYFIRVYTYALSASINFVISVSGGVLAIDLARIAATNVGNKNRIEWNTVSEENTDIFELERSVDGREFTKIYSRQANGAASNYTYIDEAPANGLNYYRLKMLTISGEYKYSKTVHAIIGNKNEFLVYVYPNPVVDNKFTVEIVGTMSEHPVLVLSDITGKLVKTVNVVERKTQIDMDTITPGIYFLKYTDGVRSNTIKLIR